MTPELLPQSAASPYIHGTGEMADRIRGHQWDETSFGPVEQWPLELVAIVNLMLASREIMTIFWGPDRLMIYNDAYIVQLGPRHPSLGRPLHEVWPDVVGQVASLIDPAFQDGTSSYLDDSPLVVMEDARETERFYSASFEPIWVREGSRSAVGGVFQTAINNTAKIQAQRALQASEAQATQILQSIGDAVIVTDKAGAVRQMNPAAERLTGWSIPEAQGRPVNEVYRLVQDDTTVRSERFPESVGHGASAATPAGRTILVAQDGTRRYIDALEYPVRAKGRELTGTVLVLRDVTQEQKDQIAREEAAARHHFILMLTDAQRTAENGREIMQISVEMLGRYLDAGRVGYSEPTADLKSMHFETGWAQGDLQVLSGSVPLHHWSEDTSADFARGRTVVYGDVRTEPALIGELQHYEEVRAVAVVAVPFLRRGVWRGSLYVNEPQPRTWTPEEVSLVEEVAQRTADAMERDQAEEELRALADRLGLAQKAGRMASWHWNTAAGYFIWDGGSEWTYGRPPSEMTQAEVIFSYLYEEDREKVRQDLVAVLEGTGEYRSEFRVVWPDGSVHWIQAFGRTVWGSNGHPTGVVGINVNITEQKRVEAASLQTEKLAAVGRLASTMAHEINNPLEAVMNLLYLARQSGDLEEAQPFLESADAELRRAASITNQALRFHKQATRPTLSTFGQLTHELLKGRHNRLKNAGATFELRDRAQQPVLCFEGELRQVLNNLVSNAIDALTGRGGTLYLRGRDGTDWGTGRAGMMLTVADTGSGMSPATQQKIFDAFFTTKGIGGTGLGLWVSKEIIERHAGRVHLRSSQGVHLPGTVFRVFLPHEAVVRDAR